MADITEMEMKKTDDSGISGEMTEAIRENTAKLEELMTLLQSQSMMEPAPLALMSETNNVTALSEVTVTDQTPADSMTGVTYILSQLQDYLGNLIYPHTSSRVTFRPDGTTVEAVLAVLTGILAGINGVSSSPDVNDEKKLATAKAVATLKTALTSLSSDLSGFHPIIDPKTGRITGYKTAAGGADTVFPFNKGFGDGIAFDILAQIRSANMSGDYAQKQAFSYTFNTPDVDKEYSLYLLNISTAGGADIAGYEITINTMPPNAVILYNQTVSASNNRGGIGRSVAEMTYCAILPPQPAGAAISATICGAKNVFLAGIKPI